MNFYPRNHQLDLDTDLFQNPEKSLLLLSQLYSPSNQGNCYSDFYHNRSLLPGLELFMNENIQYVLFVSRFF